MLNKKVFFTIFIAFLMIGCAGKVSSVTSVKQTTPPTWIDKAPPFDDGKYLYGIGINKDRESAIKTALADMVAKLGVTIESSFESNMEVKGIYLKSKTTNQIKSKISEIKINNYKVIKSYKISYKEFAVMIKTDKQQFLRGLKDDLKFKKKTIMQRDLSINKSDKITRYNTKKELAQKAKELLPEVFIVYELDKSFHKKSYVDFILQRQKEFLSEAKKLRFYIQSDMKSIRFKGVIKDYLTQNGFNVTEDKKDTISIQIKTTDNIKIATNDIVVINVEISIYDHLKYIGGNSLRLKERHLNSIDKIYEYATIHLKEDISQKGIKEVMGINLKL